MSTHNICFRGEIRKIFTGYPPLSRPMVCGLLTLPIACSELSTFFCGVWGSIITSASDYRLRG